MCFDIDGNTPLHRLCKNKSVTLDMIKLFVIQKITRLSVRQTTADCDFSVVNCRNKKNQTPIDVLLNALQSKDV